MRCAVVTGVQTFALPISPGAEGWQALPDREGQGVRRRVPDEPAVRPVLPLASYAERLTPRAFCRRSAMELASLFIAMLKPLLWLLPLFALGAVLASPWFKGLLGQYIVRLLIAGRLYLSIYRELSDVRNIARHTHT